MGEIVGLSGVLGSGRERVNSMLFGAVPANAKVISVGGRLLERLTPSKAIRAGIDTLGAGDILVIAGKGHETGQIVGDAVYPFCDREEAIRSAEALGGRAA